MIQNQTSQPLLPSRDPCHGFFLFIATGMTPFHSQMRYAKPMLVQAHPDYPAKPECCIKAVQIGCNAMKLNFLPQNAFIRSDGKPSDYESVMICTAFLAHKRESLRCRPTRRLTELTI